jgi:hypothetical protein
MMALSLSLKYILLNFFDQQKKENIFSKIFLFFLLDTIINN